MKYLSLIIFVGLLSWTWHLVHGEPDMPLETHNAIQLRMKEYIVNLIQTRRPTATDITVDKIWTELVEPGKVKATYAYSFKDSSEGSGPVTSQISGEVMLERQSEDGPGQDHWVMKKPLATNEAIQFEEATLITAGAPDEPTEPSGSTSPTTPPEANPEKHQ